MNRFLRPLAVLVTLLSFESSAVTGLELCAPGTVQDVAASAVAAHESGEHGQDHSRTPQHDDGKHCRSMQVCGVTAMLGAHVAEIEVAASPSETTSSFVSLLPGRRPAPDVPPPRA